MNLSVISNEFHGRYSITQGCSPKEMSINICWHDWSPYGRIVLQSALDNRLDESIAINVMIFGKDAENADKQDEMLGNFSHGYGEVIYVNGKFRSQLINLIKTQSADGLDWSIIRSQIK